MKAKRQSIVEPVFGTSKRFMALRKVNTLGIRNANKCILMAAIAYNLKKYWKFIKKTPVSQTEVCFTFVFRLKPILNHQISRLEHMYF
ncbi:transposase [uncultured Aquimarina sp.]|uniref:transposase n=1 Tax=uncultured Aquimarina sp. TaxID=575652 RepID=UPI00260A8624|nr:transposase [uncultured Aquimarina sp.]